MCSPHLKHGGVITLDPLSWQGGVVLGITGTNIFITVNVNTNYLNEECLPLDFQGMLQHLGNHLHSNLTLLLPLLMLVSFGGKATNKIHKVFLPY